MSAPPKPTNLHPADVVEVPTNTPLCTVNIQRGAGNDLKVRARFRIATDLALTTNVKSFTEPAAKNNNGGRHQMNVPSNMALRQGLWYIGAYAVQQTTGLQSVISDKRSFMVTHPLLPVPVSPSLQRWQYQTGTIPLTWRFTSTWAKARQTAYQVIILQDDDTPVYDSGKITSTAQTIQANMLGSNLNQVLKWQVILWDEDDIDSDPSPFAYFIVTNGPTIDITAPSGSLAEPGPVVTWDYTPGAGEPQLSFQIVVVDNNFGVQVYDSGAITSGDTSFQLPGDFWRNGGDYGIYMNVVDYHTWGLAAGQANIEVTTDWSQPDAPASTADGTDFPNQRVVHVTWDNGSPDANFYAWRVYRRDLNDPSDTYMQASADLSSDFNSFDDYSAPLGTSVEYTVVQVKNVNGGLVESGYGGFSGDPIDTTTSIYPYYLIFDPNPSAALPVMILRQCTDDSFDDEIEQAEMLIINRGRRIESGTEWGYKGTLEVTFYDDEEITGLTGRQQLQQLKTLLRQGTFYLLTNPFGDSWKVRFGQMSATRIGGVGTREFAQVSLPYSEVF